MFEVEKMDLSSRYIVQKLGFLRKMITSGDHQLAFDTIKNDSDILEGFLFGRAIQHFQHLGNFDNNWNIAIQNTISDFAGPTKFIKSRFQ